MGTSRDKRDELEEANLRQRLTRRHYVAKAAWRSCMNRCCEEPTAHEEIEVKAAQARGQDTRGEASAPARLSELGIDRDCRLPRSAQWATGRGLSWPSILERRGARYCQQAVVRPRNILRKAGEP